MLIDRRGLLGAAIAAPLLAPVAAQAGAPAPERIALWPGLPPGATTPLPRLKVDERTSPGRTETWLTGIATPVIELFRPARPNGTGILQIPGGGYEFLAYSNEGTDIARVLAAMGFTVAVLTYRLPAEGWQRQADVPLQDAQRGMRLFRAHAPGLARFGVLGCSAGGHLAGTLATAHAERVYAAVDPHDDRPARPDFAGLLYAVTTLELPATHIGSREHLLGPAPAAAEVVRRSPVDHVDGTTPPCFLLHAFDDTVVPVACSLAWMAACRTAQVPVEAHLLQRGGHGFGVHLPPSNPGALWPQQFDRWVAQLVTRP